MHALFLDFMLRRNAPFILLFLCSVIGKAAITGKYQWIFSGGDNGALNGFGPGQPVVRPRMEKVHVPDDAEVKLVDRGLRPVLAF